MSETKISAGEVLPLIRAVAGDPDPLDLFVQTCAGGKKADTLLLESGDTDDRRSEKSLIVVSSALRFTCRGHAVKIDALNANGRSVLPWFAQVLAQRATIAATENSCTARFERPDCKDEDARLQAPSPVDVLRAITKLKSASSANVPLVAGIFSYDLLGMFETLPPAARDELGWPDFEFWLPDRTIAVQHRQNSAVIVAHVFGGQFREQAYHDATDAIAQLSAACKNVGPRAAREETISMKKLRIDPQLDMSDSDYMKLVTALKKHIDLGDIFQVVPSRTFSLPCADAVGAYRRLRAINPSPYMFFVNGTRGTLFGSSPETAIKVDAAPRRVEIRPIAGTRPRARKLNGEIDRDLDAKLEADLRLDEKEIAEHMMLVDLARNDVARVSEPGTRVVDKLLSVERYSHVMHLVSQVSGQLRADLDALHAYLAAMNMGTLVGAPKLKAAELLRRHEVSARGPYGGAVGYFMADGRMDTSIVIRSAVVQNGMAHVRAGAGVVTDSVPESEMMETRRKAEAVLRAIAEMQT